MVFGDKNGSFNGKIRKIKVNILNKIKVFFEKYFRITYARENFHTQESCV
jgi:hypothetical protein